jgi:peptidoglycan hydrolase-like protein with peptidoglycan-binding domain
MYKKIIALSLAVSLTACVPNNTRRSNSSNQYAGSQNTSHQQPVPSYPLQSRQEIMELQQLLAEQGYRPGKVDGHLGKNTTDAIRRFQRSQGLPVEGLATSTVLQQLRPGYSYQAASSSSAQKLRHEAKFFSKSTAQAAAGGAAIGALIGVLAGGKEGALIGAGAGALLGAGTDYALNSARAGAANTEVDLNQTISHIRQQNERLSRMISSAKQLIADDKRAMTQIKRQLKQKTISKRQAAEQYASLDENRQLLQATYNDLKNTQREWQQIAASNGNTPEITREVEKLRIQIASLEEELGELDQLRSISQVG